MKPFDLERAKAGEPIITRDGSKVRIICWDLVSSDMRYPIIGLVMHKNGCEDICFYTTNGYFSGEEHSHRHDLMMASIKKEGWVNIYENNLPYVGRLHRTKELALLDIGSNYITTIKIEWEV